MFFSHEGRLFTWSVLWCAQEYYVTMLGTNSFKKAIEEAEKLSESLKLRLEVSAVTIMLTFLIQTL